MEGLFLCSQPIFNHHDMKNLIYCLSFLPVFLFVACDDDEMITDPGPEPITISALNFIGEQIIADGETFDGSVVGGLSSIDYANNTFYVIADDPNAPIRFYSMDLTFDETSFSAISILSQTELLDTDGMPFASGQADPEAIRFDVNSGNIVWASEGYSNGVEVDPFVREATIDGAYVSEFTLPTLFEADSTADQGSRNNGVFEGLSLSVNGEGYWVGMELPLVQDGPAPIFGSDTDSPVRIAYIDRSSGTYGRQFAYELEPVVRDGGFTVNGVVEVLEYEADQFLVMERSFASGTDDGGNDVRIYKVDASAATDVSTLDALMGASYTKATKTLLLDFNDIRDQLSSVPGGSTMVVDNVEGMTFGPDFANGNKSLVVVADNNFSAFGAQLNQFIVFEILP